MIKFNAAMTYFLNSIKYVKFNTYFINNNKILFNS